jgi:hypothetical protein
VDGGEASILLGQHDQYGGGVAIDRWYCVNVQHACQFLVVVFRAAVNREQDTFTIDLMEMACKRWKDKHNKT